MFKEKLSEKFGTVFYYAFIAIATVLLVVPLFILGFPWWVNMIIFFVCISFDTLGGLTELVIYIWAFTQVIGDALSTLSIIFYVCFGVYILITFLPQLIMLIASIIIAISDRRR